MKPTNVRFLFLSGVIAALSLCLFAVLLWVQDARAAEPQVTFISPTNGLVFCHCMSGFMNVTGQAFPLGMRGVGGGSVTWGDYNNDSNLDLLITGWDGSGTLTQLWHNEGNGTFTDVTGNALPNVPNVYGSSAAWGDYDNDGDLDLCLTGATVDVFITQLWQNKGDATFEDVTASSFQPGVPGISMGAIAWVDYDNDGDLDLLLTGAVGGSGIVQLWQNNSDGTFEDVTVQVMPDVPAVFGSSVDWADYDNDGDLDLLLTGNAQTPVCQTTQLWRNNLGGTFDDVTNDAVPGISAVRDGSVAWGDYDSNGFLDLLISGFTGSCDNRSPVTELWRNNADGTFENVTTEAMIDVSGVALSSTSWGDYDNDSDLDLLLTGCHSSDISDCLNNPVTQLWENKGDGSFDNVTEDMLPGVPDIFASAVAWGDYDNDADFDLIIAGRTRGYFVYITQLWRNEAGLLYFPSIFKNGCF